MAMVDVRLRNQAPAPVARHDERRSVWASFDADEQRQMIDDDLTAGRSVSLVLIAVVTTVMTAPLLRWAVGQADQHATGVEGDRPRAEPEKEISA